MWCARKGSSRRRLVSPRIVSSSSVVEQEQTTDDDDDIIHGFPHVEQQNLHTRRIQSVVVHSAPEESFGETVELPYPSGLLLRLLLLPLPRFVFSWVFLLL